MGRPIALLLTLSAILLGAPLLGLTLDGQSLSPYLSMPPRSLTARHASFSWVAFVGLSALIIACLAPLIRRILTSRPAPARWREPRRPLPWWGWLGFGLLLLSWFLAWNRFTWFAPLQRHTFTPIWVGYVLVINALAWQREGRCMLTHRTRHLLALFPLSACFWWYFEYLNRFVQNWYYVDVASLEPWQYFLQATLPFSTVLPAVLCTRDYLATFPRLQAGLGAAWRVRSARPRALSTVTLVGCTMILMAMGLWPGLLFPMVWVAPLLVLLSLQVLFARRTILAPLARGDWREPWLAALAALMCGLLWELWNVNSLALWQYAIPHVHRFEVFEMPLLGFAGYLPFGLQCLAAGRLFESEPGDAGGSRPDGGEVR
jgi:hypothetical protein